MEKKSFRIPLHIKISWRVKYSNSRNSLGVALTALKHRQNGHAYGQRRIRSHATGDSIDLVARVQPKHKLLG